MWVNKVKDPATKLQSLSPPNTKEEPNYSLRLMGDIVNWVIL
jgi:hypothetical protein